jgi:hypothetical protein
MKFNLKKITALLLATAMISAVSCGNKSEESSSSDGIQSTTTEDEADLGEYVISTLGTKLYYDSEEIPEELMNVLEKYFISFAENDYDSYAECVYPDYITEMNEYLESDYDYQLDQSFQNQCDSLVETSGGDFTVTRIKAEPYEEDGTEEFFDTLNECFGKDFYEQVKNDSDELYDLTFYVMADVDGDEFLLISGYEIVFAEKDGNYYVFG